MLCKIISHRFLLPECVANVNAFCPDQKKEIFEFINLLICECYIGFFFLPNILIRL